MAAIEKILTRRGSEGGMRNEARITENSTGRLNQKFSKILRVQSTRMTEMVAKIRQASVN